MLKFIEIGSKKLSLSAQHILKFFENKNQQCQFTLYPAFDESLLEGTHGVLIDPEYSSQIFGQFAPYPALVNDIECFDSFFCENQHWLPRVIFYESTRELIVKRIRDLDTRTPAFIIGDNEVTKIMAAIVISLGFSKIYIVSSDESRLSRICKLIRKKYIGLDLIEVPSTSLTVQNEQAGIMINTLDLKTEAELKNDISYFNFMKRNALVIDTFLEGARSVLCEEALAADLRAISLEDLYCARDLLFLSKSLPPEVVVNEVEYKDSWLNFLKSLP